MTKQLSGVLFLAALATTGCTIVEGAGDDDGGGDGGGADGGGGGGGGGAKVCTSARLLSGDPTWRSDIDRTMWNPAGHGLRATPPLIAMNLAGRGSKLAISSQESIWLADLAAASPSFTRIAGVDNLQPSQFTPSGACRDARTMAGAGMSFHADGRLVVGDGWGNGVMELSDPSSPTCTATPIAGTQTAITSRDLMSGQIFQAGDVVGPGAQARFRRPQHATTDDAGNAYVWDQSNRKIKKIAGDAAHTVSVIGDLTARDPEVHAMTVLGGKLYAVANDNNGDVLFEVDPAGATPPRVVFEGRNVFDMSAGSAGIPVGITNDGRDLIVLLFKGYIYRVAPATGVATLIAGDGRQPGGSFPSEIDLAQPVPAAELILSPLSQTQGGGYIHWNAGHLYVPSAYPSGAGWAVWDVTCPP